MARRLWRYIGLSIVFILLLSACGKGFIATGVSESSQFDRNNGWLEKSYQQANGSTIQEIELGRPGRTLSIDIALTLGEGAFQIELLDVHGDVRQIIDGTPGQTVNSFGVVETGPFGNAKYRVTAVEATDVKYRMEFDIR
jgi:hypothetical protein